MCRTCRLCWQSLGPGRLSWAAAQALLALEQCFSHDGGQFLDEQRFQRLLPPLVAQLSAGPAAAAADARPAAAAADAGPRSIVAELADLLPQDLAGEADAEIETTSSSRLAAEHHHRLSLAEDPYGVALAAVLVRMAAAAGSDTLHRPLNRSVRAEQRQCPPHSKLACTTLGRKSQATVRCKAAADTSKTFTGSLGSERDAVLCFIRSFSLRGAATCAPGGGRWQSRMGWWPHCGKNMPCCSQSRCPSSRSFSRTRTQARTPFPAANLYAAQTRAHSVQVDHTANTVGLFSDLGQAIILKQLCTFNT